MSKLRSILPRLIGQGPLRLPRRPLSASPASEVDPQVRETILSILRGMAKVDPSKLSDSARFEDLGLDSLDAVEAIVAFEEHLKIELDNEDAEEKIKNVADAIRVFSLYKTRPPRSEAPAEN